MVNPPERQTRRQRIASAVWAVLSVLIGWTSFTYWWMLVLRRTAVAILVTSLEELGATMLVLSVVAALWIAHNRRLAARGHRGRASKYINPVFETDYLSRKLDLPARYELRHSAAVVITATDTEKTYAVQLP
jgi:hypothetical protein